MDGTLYTVIEFIKKIEYFYSNCKKGKCKMKILFIALICLYIAINIVTAKIMDTKEMKEKFITGQCLVGKIAANIFYAPAWLLKVFKIVIWFMVK